MIKRVLFLIALCFCFLSTQSMSADIMEIRWENLKPQLPPQEDPLAGLSDEELGDVEWIIYLRLSLPPEVTEGNEAYYDEVNEALPKLKKKGIDVDEIIAQRRERNSAVNTELDGRNVRLTGYLLPLDLSGNAVTDFLLVPFVGACIHVPPPPPNQIVHAVSATPTPYEIERLYAPVSVTGKIEVKSLSKELFLMDGSSDINIGYSMTVDKIEEYKPPK